jgi:hypothetical protein
VHQASAIDDIFSSFVNTCLSRIFQMSKGIVYLSELYATNLCKQKPSSANADEDRRSMTIVFVRFFYSLEFFPTPNLSALGAMFSCRFLIWVLRSFRHEVSQVQNKPDLGDKGHKNKTISQK